MNLLQELLNVKSIEKSILKRVDNAMSKVQKNSSLICYQSHYEQLTFSIFKAGPHSYTIDKELILEGIVFKIADSLEDEDYLQIIHSFIEELLNENS